MIENMITNGGGMSDAELGQFITASQALVRRIEGMNVRNFQAEVSVRDRDTPNQAVTMEMWLNDLPRLVATSTHEELDVAFAQVSSKMLTQLNKQKDKRVKRREHPFEHMTEEEKLVFAPKAAAEEVGRDEPDNVGEDLFEAVLDEIEASRRNPDSRNNKRREVELS